MKKTIAELLAVPPENHDLAWLKDSLQVAVELELSTIPPYLCGMWSVKDSGDPARNTILEIVLEEMLHLGLACNMLTTLGGTPSMTSPDSVPKYPRQGLPGGVRPGVRVALSRLTKDVVTNVFMDIEYPENGPVAMFNGEMFPTIGAFYSAVLDAFEALPEGSITGARQLVSGSIGLFKVIGIDDVRKAIQRIKQQGEGTSQTPFADVDASELAHYYRFGELSRGRRLMKDANGKWVYEGDCVLFPDTWPVAEVPSGGYTESLEFDRKYTGVLRDLQQAWETGDQQRLGAAVIAMGDLEDLALELMKKPLPTGAENFGPSFKLTADVAPVHATVTVSGTSTIASAPPFPVAIVNLMAQREHRVHHYLWHEVRNGWNFYDEATRSAIRALGWEPPRPSMKRTATGRTFIVDNDSGEDFLYMHRQMIALVNQRLAEIGDPNYPRVVGWPSLPQITDADYPVPPAWDAGDPDLNAYLQETKSDAFYAVTLTAWERQFRDEAWLRSRSLGELGARIEFTIHNRMHMRWCSNPGAIRPDVDVAHPDDIDPRWDSPGYDWLGDTYASHVHRWFWKIHGWVDDRIDDWKRANGVTGEIVWKGTWIGKMPPHPAPSSLHAILTASAAPPMSHHDHGSEMQKMLRLVLRSGVRTRFYDRVQDPA